MVYNFGMDMVGEKFDKEGELGEVFKQNNVLFAYLFGSQIGENSNKKSDVDIAVMLPQGLSKNERFDLRLKLIGEIGKILKKDVDLIILNDTKSLFFKYVILKEGKVIYVGSDSELALFESKTLGLYFDFRPFLESYNKNYVKRALQ